MLLEASLCLRPVVALSYSDGVHFNPAQGYFHHFDGVEEIPGFSQCRDKAELRALLRGALLRPPLDAGESDDVTEYFLRRPTPNYTASLSRLIAKLASAQHDKNLDGSIV
jgi:hypothetical protein